MSMIPWDPWTEMEQLRARTDQLWDHFFAKLTEECRGPNQVNFLPDADLVETAYDYRVYLAVPGLIEDDLDIEATANSLTVRGERQPPYDPTRQHVREWRYGFFERQLTFPEPIRVDKIQATYDAGVLTVLIPKQSSSEKNEG